MSSEAVPEQSCNCIKSDVISLPQLVVIMPALNEEATIASVIERIPRSVDGVDQVEVVVVDDGSADKTAELSRQASAHVVSHPENLGVGKAFASGIDAALKLGADIIVNIDSDGQFSPEDVGIDADGISANQQ